MAYDAEPVASDVILSTWEERGEIIVRLYLREGEDGFGEEVESWHNEECREMFEEGDLKRRPVGRLSDGDTTLRDSAFAYAKKNNLGALAGFKERVSAMVEAAADNILATYNEVEAATEPKPDEDPEDTQERVLLLTPRKAMQGMAFAKLSDDRHDEIEEYLQACLEEALSARPPAP